MNFKNFLLGKEADFKGRTIQEIWDFSDIQIEGNHDFIQLIFPLNKKSQNVFHGYYLDNEDLINELKESHQIRENIIKSSFYIKNIFLPTPYFLLVYLKYKTCIITERDSITNTPPIIISKISFLSKIAKVPNAVPSAKLPVSPIKINAG